MILYTQKDFIFEKDSAISSECFDCGNYYNEGMDECTGCGNTELLFETSHEGLTCELCLKYFDMWEDLYITNKHGATAYCCEICFHKTLK